MATDTCQIDSIDAQRIARARQAMPEADSLSALADTFRVLGDFTRVRILAALATGELCVCDLASLVGVSPSAISHQLRLLRTARLVRCRREGKMAYYALDDDHVHTLFAEGLRHVQED